MRKVLVFGLMFGMLAAWNAGCTGDDDDDDHEAPVSIAISGGTVVNVGSNLQLTATATYEDASTEDITTQSAWTTSSAANATVGAATGLVTGVSSGPATITATHDGISGDVAVTVGTGGTATFNGTVNGAWSAQHAGGGTFFARIVDNAGGAVIFCGSETNGDGSVSVVAPGALVAGHTYHAEMFMDFDGDGMSDDVGHLYQSPAGVAVGANQTFTVLHSGTAPTWTGVACP